MDIVDYRKEIKRCNASEDAKRVLRASIKIAEGDDREFVNQVDVLRAVARSPQRLGLVERLAAVGLTYELIDGTVRGLNRYVMPGHSYEHIQHMFSLTAVATDARITRTVLRPSITPEDLMFASIATGGRVINTVIKDGIKSSTFRVLTELGAPDQLTLMFFGQGVDYESPQPVAARV